MSATKPVRPIKKLPVELVDHTALIPAAYNPRLADRERLELVSLSLRKLGWLLPVYATYDGEIISGHQRHLVSGEDGFSKVPVRRVNQDKTDRRMSLNLVFNRATNDMDRKDRTSELKASLLASSVREELLALPDLPESRRYPCADPEWVNTKKLQDANAGTWRTYAHVMARSMRANYAIQMPCVVDKKTLKVVNGIGRLQEACALADPAVEVVWVEHKHAALAERVLNLLSMDFTLHIKYADVLRFNSFRRVNTGLFPLSVGYIFVVEKQNNRTWDNKSPENRKKWLSVYGRSVVDFGAGRGTSSAVMREMGAHVAEFEPYRIPDKSNTINRVASVELAQAFLDDVRSRRMYASVFLADVFNSVPFLADRLHIVQIVSALLGSAGRAYAQVFDIRRKNELDREHLSDKGVNIAKFPLDYETGIIIGELSGKPKIQKYHTATEFYELLKTGFGVVDLKTHAGTKNKLSAVCARPHKPDPEKLAAALRFEFDLPYPDGQRMGLADEALDSFGYRLGLRLR